MNRKEVVAVLDEEIRVAEKSLAKARKAEEDWDYSDSTLSMERTFAEGYLEALYFLKNSLEDNPKKKKKSTKKKGKK